MATPSAAQHRDLEERFRKIEAAVKALASAVSKRPKFEVSAGDLTINGGDLVVDGGDFLLLDTDGSTVFRLGPQAHGDRGVSIYRENGAAAVSVAKVFPTDADQVLRIHDRHGNAILSESVFGTGHDAPYVPLPFRPVAPASTALQVGPYGPEASVASDTFTDVFKWRGVRGNPYLRFRFQVLCSDATTSAEVRVIRSSDSFVLAPFFQPGWVGERDAGSTDYVTVEPLAGLGAAAPFGAMSELAVQVRRSAGAGTVTLALETATGGSV